MPSTDSPSAPKRSPEFRAIFWGGLIAGVLDLGFAATSFMLRGKDAVFVLKVVAGGALGRGALQGGAGVAALGLLFHFCISFTVAAVYVGASRRLRFLNRHWVVSGLIYGLAVYEFMNLVVLPLSAYHKPLAFPPLLVPDVLSHLFFVGLVIAFVAARSSATTK